MPSMPARADEAPDQAIPQKGPGRFRRVLGPVLLAGLLVFVVGTYRRQAQMERLNPSLVEAVRSGRATALDLASDAGALQSMRKLIADGAGEDLKGARAAGGRGIQVYIRVAALPAGSWLEG